MKALRVPPMYKCIGLVDADLLDNAKVNGISLREYLDGHSLTI